MNLDFLSQLSETHLGAGGIGLLVFGVVFGLIKGVFRILLGIVGLAAAAVAFWFAFRHGDTIASKFVEEPDAWMPLGIAGGAASAAYLAVRHGVGLILTPILGTVDSIKNKKLIAGTLGLGLGGAGLYGGGSASHQVDAMQFLNEQRQGVEENWVSKVLAKSQESWFGQFQQSTDPSNTGYRCDLVKLLSLAKFDSSAANSAEVQSILSRPEIAQMMSDPKIKQALSNGDFQELFRSERITNFLQDRDNKELLKKLDWRKIL